MSPYLLSQVFQCLKDAIRAGINGNRRTITPCDHSGAVNHEESTLAASIAFSISPVFFGDFALGLKVSEQWEVQMAVLCKCFMTPYAVNGDAEKFRSIVLKLRKNLVVKRHLVATDGTPIGRIEGKNDRFSAQFTEGQLLVGRDMKCEVWCGRSAI